MKNKTKEEIVKEVVAYLEKTAKHVFITETGHMYKIVMFKHNDKDYYATLLIGKDQIQINVREIVSDNDFNYYRDNFPNLVKQTLFPIYYKAKSIPNFKKIRKLVEEIIPQLSSDRTSNLALANRLKIKLPELERVQ